MQRISNKQLLNTNFVINATRNPDLTTDSRKFAISDKLWLNDLAYKYEIHYRRRYKFAW